MKRYFLLVLLAGGCSCGSPGSTGDDDDDDPTCSDQDQDGYGVGAGCSGSDCNDYVAEIHTQDQCDDWCAGNSMSPGCPCDSAEPEPCYLGPADTLGTGECKGGLTRCEDGAWGACAGQVLPLDETCDDLDNDCNGEVDEGVQNECGGCGDCEEGCMGPAEECDDWGDDRTGLVETPEGWLVLDGTSISLHVIWPSSSGAGHIYRVNTETHEIEAGFWTGPGHAGGGGGSDSPSRTAVDDFGNVIIANRAFGGQGSFTKIAAASDTCPDRNGNGRIDTSAAWDDKMPFPTHDDWDDECILWHSTAGGINGVPRALAIHQEVGLDGVLEERGWLGIHSEHKVVQFDTEDGSFTGIEAPTGSFTPYGGAIDREGWMWLSSWPSNDVGKFDTANPDDSFEISSLPIAGQQSLRVIVDENDNPWISGPDAMRYNRDTDEWEGAGVGVGGGGWDFALGNIASDGQGSIWVATYNTRQEVFRIENDDDFGFTRVATPGTSTFGMGCDFDGQCWTFGSTNNAYVIDIETEDGEVALNDCGGGPCLNYPYVRGDITGLQRRNALNPAGTWQTALEGCGGDETDWSDVEIDALTPAGTQIVVQARTADTLVGLAGKPWVGVGTLPPDGPVLDLDAPFAAAGVTDGPYLGLKVSLQSLDGASSPTLRGVSVHWGCGMVIK